MFLIVNLNMNLNGPILLFDGVCNLCNALVNFIIRRDYDAKIKFAALQTPAGQSLLRKFDLATVGMDTVVYVVGDKYYLRSAAVLHVLKELGGGWRLFYSFIIVPEFIRDSLYNLIARSRYKIFGKSDTCRVPTPETEKRFLS
jgi:predicted DCC family thiol-disulfide oxidoreductase YuxK